MTSQQQREARAYLLRLYRELNLECDDTNQRTHDSQCQYQIYHITEYIAITLDLFGFFERETTTTTHSVLTISPANSHSRHRLRHS